MGCSPSKGKLFSKSDGKEPQNAALPEASQDRVDSKPVEEEDVADGKENDPPSATEEHGERQTTWSQVASKENLPQSGEDRKDIERNGMPQATASQLAQTGKVKKTAKRKKNEGKRRPVEKLCKSSIIQTKLDFPPHMVRAHQAAYAYLNPNISKYETLLGLLDQAAHTQLSLQPMMSAFVLRFEEINQALEEMAEEGELMLKEHGEYMALPSGMMGPAVMLSKSITDKANSTGPPPDLVQQLLQHSTEKMRMVGGSVQALGDTTLEEAVEYFSSLSKLLVQKLHAKQAAEQRLTRVLAQVEGAVMRKSNPEDSALHSEDSGIGGENESLTGSERHARHRGSAGSGSCGSGVHIRSAPDTFTGGEHNLVGHHEDSDEEEEEEEEDEDEEEEEEEEKIGRKRSNSSPPDPSQPLLHMLEKYGPTAAKTKSEQSSGVRCVNTAMGQLKNMSEVQGKREFHRSGLRRHSLSGSEGAQKGPLKTNPSNCFLPMLIPQPPKRNCVRRLINTFSQGVDGRPGQSLANVPPHIRRPRKNRTLPSSDTENPADLVVNGNNNNNSWPDGRDVLDVDSLPPPPPEVLLDNSFQGSAQSLPMINQKTRVSQRLRTCVSNVEVLPNRVGVKLKPAVMESQGGEHQPDSDLEHRSVKGPSPPPARRHQSGEGSGPTEDDVSNCSMPWTAPPVSRVCLPPSCPSVRHPFPSPPVCRPSSRPSSPGPSTEDFTPSVSFRDARSVFCQKESQNHQSWTSSGSSVLPRPWGAGSRGRLPTRGTDITVRRTQSEQRPNSTATQTKESEPGTMKQRPSHLLMAEVDTQ